MRAPQKRNWVARLKERFGVSERRALRIVSSGDAVVVLVRMPACL